MKNKVKSCVIYLNQVRLWKSAILVNIFKEWQEKQRHVAPLRPCQSHWRIVKRFKRSISLIQHNSQPQLLLTKRSLITAGIASFLQLLVNQTENSIERQDPIWTIHTFNEIRAMMSKNKIKLRWLCWVTPLDNNIDFSQPFKTPWISSI